MIYISCMLYAVNSGKKARCHCDQLNKHKYSACPHPPSLVLLPFPFTHGLCSVTWLRAVLKLWGRRWDFNERSGVSVYITIAVKGSREIRAPVMIGFVSWFFSFFLKRQADNNLVDLECGKTVSSHIGNQIFGFWTTEGSKMRTASLTSCPLVQLLSAIARSFCILGNFYIGIWI